MKATSPITPYMFVLFLVVVVGHVSFVAFLGTVLLLIIVACVRVVLRDVRDHPRPARGVRR